LSLTSQFNFAAGELAPALRGRVDQVRYQTGLSTLRNFLVLKSGGVANRPGTAYVGEGRDPAAKVRLIPFVFNNDQTYVLEFGNLYMRVIKDGGQLTETAVNITGITRASVGVVTTSGAHGYSNGDRVYISGVSGMVEVNNGTFIVANATSTTFELQNSSGTNINTLGYTAYSSGGTVARIYQITTPYATADLFELKFEQNADVVTIVHETYRPS
jgi:hypothetical protein